MPKLSCVGDSYACGAVAVEGSEIMRVNGKPVVCLNDVNSHGAPQIACSSIMRINGEGVARIGDLCAGHFSPPHLPNPLTSGSFVEVSS